MKNKNSIKPYIIVLAVMLLLLSFAAYLWGVQQFMRLQ
ncbi:hypothetical protein C426_0308 [Lactococcus garvieae DCC43]|uniref:Uncharacterized protein n=1 Tax=Lactococcus garvieae DCC43 TaxID=1231377 RepID=K2PYA4_9LACT|nr:hypothetical protein C426_0308 [Lactococcus garvieae DCC43]